MRKKSRLWVVIIVIVGIVLLFGKQLGSLFGPKAAYGSSQLPTTYKGGFWSYAGDLASGVADLVTAIGGLFSKKSTTTASGSGTGTGGTGIDDQPWLGDF